MVVFRGTGKTTRQLRSAPTKAVFVCFGAPNYTERLARELGRDDLRIFPYEKMYSPRNFDGVQVPIVLDHAVEIHDQTRPAYAAIRMMNERFD